MLRPINLVTRTIAQKRLSSITQASSTYRSPLAKFHRTPWLPRKISTTVRPTVRYNSSLSVPGSKPSKPETTAQQPSYELTFTCKPCGHRSTHRISKQGYHHGTVLIQCPDCKNRHVISDHLKIFMDQKSTLEDILKRSAEGGDLSKLLKKGQLGIRQGQLVGNEGEEDLEFWEDGTESKHVPAQKENK